MTARKGLRKCGLRSYIITGPRRSVIIERDRRGHFLVRPESLPRVFNYGDYPFLRDAVSYARRLTGDLEELMPPFLDRRNG